MESSTVSYMAGFFDGEGYVGIGYNGRAEVRIVNSYLPILEEFKTKYGGSIYTRKKTKERHKTYYDWILIGKKELVTFFDDISPFLREKKSKIATVRKIKDF